MEPAGKVRFVLKTPGECNKAELQAFSRLVKKGNEVNLQFLKTGLQRTHQLAFCYAGTRLVGIAALKKSGIGYQNDVFDRAGVPEYAGIYSHEIGYISTHERFRKQGICTALIQRLLRQTTEPIFATARSQNKDMINILQRFGFLAVGHRFLGRHKRPEVYYVRLFIRPPPKGK
jgi:predicted GNAT family N-acyltransferase